MSCKLSRTFAEKIWGVDTLPSEFGCTSSERIGEIWFSPPPEMPELLVKYIFASERLSVQVHPDDEQASAMDIGVNGKSECWIIVDAQPGATIAVGFKDTITSAAMCSAALDGSILDLLAWHEVLVGDAFYIPAGTVHAIGGGVSLIEVQQNSDITFRLYDYGRPRELHLEQGIEVADPNPYPGTLRSRIDGAGGWITDNPHFQLCYQKIDGDAVPPVGWNGSALAIPFSGTFSLNGEYCERGDCVLVGELEAARINGQGILLFARPSAKCLGAF